ncbi:MAG TPA: hypothetical protein VGI45_21565 [Terracidiphilus sp.]|jgi:hypothetical protein
MIYLRPGLISAILLSSFVGAAQSKPPAVQHVPSVDSVMIRVAVNQDAAEAERAHYVYVQHSKMTSRRGKTVMCEEITDYRFTPSADDTHEQLLKVDGRYLKNHKFITYDKLLPRDEDKPKDADKDKDKDKSAAKDTDKKEKKEKKDKEKEKDPVFDPNSDETLDRDLVENLRWNLIHDKSKDGIAQHLFPLTSKDQANYTFRMIGRERLNDRDVFHITFRPKEKNDFGWSGDAYIDTQAFQPVLVTTGMARKIPFAVRTLLGTDVPGLGFTIRYAPQPDGVWFPVDFSTEFKIHVLYFFHRQVILDAQSRDFEKTHVTSRIVGDATPVEPRQP